MKLKFFGQENAGGVTIDGEHWFICNKGSKAFCMCKAEDQGSGHPRTKYRLATKRAIKKAYKEGLFADPFALTEEDKDSYMGCLSCLRLVLRRIFK